jgi:hypothetical protein
VGGAEHAGAAGDEEETAPKALGGEETTSKAWGGEETGAQVASCGESERARVASRVEPERATGSTSAGYATERSDGITKRETRC